jgi:hypothetical protein
LEKGNCLRTLEGHIGAVEDVNITPDGRRVVSGSEDKTLRVWDMESGKCLGVLAVTAPVTAVASSSGLLTIGTETGEVYSVDMYSFSPGPAVVPDTSDSAYEALLRRGLDRSRCEKTPDHGETLAHLTALVVHLERMGRTDEARSLHPTGNDLVKGRAAALQAYLAGDYARAEPVLRSLIVNGFEIPGMRCHLGRILLIQDRFEETLKEATAAWNHRAEAPAYIIPRILWLELALLCVSLDEKEAGIQAAPVIIGRLKTALACEGAHMEWTMDPVLEHLQPRVSTEQHRLLAALVAALNDAKNLPVLEQFPAWRAAQPQPLE